MDPRLPLEMAVGPRATNGDGGALDPGHFVILAVEEFDGELVLGGPGGIHPQEHLGPVVGVGAAVAGIEAHEGIGGVVGAGEERGEFEGVEFSFEALGLTEELPFERFIFAGELFEGLEISAGGEGLVERLEDRVDRLQLGNSALSLLGIVPEAGLRHRVFDAGGVLLASSPVKESLGVGGAGRESC